MIPASFVLAGVRERITAGPRRIVRHPPPLALLLEAVLLHQRQIVLAWRGEDVDPLESGWCVPAVLNVGGMDADVARLHGELLASADMLLGALQDDQDLLR